MSPSWEEIRGQMLLPADAIYLNTGSYGIVPRVVFDRVTELRREMQADPVDFLWRKINANLWAARERLATFLQCEPRRLIFTTNVSMAINIVAASLRLATPGEILLTNHEYGAMRWAWERTAQRQGLTLRTFRLPELPREPYEITAAVETAIRPETRLLFFSHILHTDGTILPLKEIGQVARRRGVLTMVDGAHAPGMVPLALDADGCDFYGANLHKWLCAPVGAGFLHVAAGNEDRIQPLNVSWGWHFDRTKAHDRDDFGGTPWLRSFEFEGSKDVCPWLVVPEAIDFQERTGAQPIRDRIRELADYVRSRLDGLAGLRLMTPEHSELRGGLTAFRLPKHDLLGLRKGLWDKNRIEVNIIEHPDGNLLRISTHFYNTEAEIDRLAEVLPGLLT